MKENHLLQFRKESRQILTSSLISLKNWSKVYKMMTMNELVDLRMQQQIAHEIYRQQIIQRIPGTQY